VKRTVSIGFVAVGWVILSAAAAFASRAELDGRGLPRFLADDPTNLPVFPGGAAGLPSQMLVDFIYGPGYDYPEPFESRDPSDRLAVALFGRHVKLGYVLDGPTHHLVLGMPRGFGFILGFSDRHDEDEDYTKTEWNGQIEESFDYTKTSETQIRASLGWSGRLGDRRTLSIALAGSYLDSEIRSKSKRVLDGEITEDVHQVVESDPGAGWEISLQSLDPEAGPLIAARYSDTNRNPHSEEIAATAWRSRRASLDLAWRWTPEMLDDLVFGWTSSWSKDESPVDLNYSSHIVDRSEAEIFRGGVFVSGEKRILESLVARAGVLARGYFEDRAYAYARSSGDYLRYSSDSSSTGRIESPRIFLGGSWSWKNLRVDVRLNESISLYNPFIRWSAALLW